MASVAGAGGGGRGRGSATGTGLGLLRTPKRAVQRIYRGLRCELRILTRVRILTALQQHRRGIIGRHTAPLTTMTPVSMAATPTSTHLRDHARKFRNIRIQRTLLRLYAGGTVQQQRRAGAPGSHASTLTPMAMTPVPAYEAKRGSILGHRGTRASTTLLTPVAMTPVAMTPPVCVATMTTPSSSMSASHPLQCTKSF